MNGAAMDCRPENVLRSQNQDTTGLRSPGYHLQNIHPRLQNSHPHPQHSKAMNYKSLSDDFVDGSAEYFQTNRHINNIPVHTGTCRSGIEEDDPRFQARLFRIREPIELPVPKFEIDENYVGDLPTVKDSKCLENSKDLDLDTRINLLIKSKALAGMHPIFSELDQSEDSGPDSDESFLLDKPKRQHRLARNHRLSPPPQEQIPYVESFDDPEKPLSRPPSPFLSRATYLFWFNKAIELKQQAKAQEQALLEKATKKLLDSAPIVVSSQTAKPNEENKPLLKNLLNEVCKELKVIVKEDFIREVVESTAFSTLEDWWERQSKLKEQDELKESLVGNSNTEEIKVGSVRSTSPKLPYPRKKDYPKRRESLSKRKSNSHKKTSHKQSSSSSKETDQKTDTTTESSSVIAVKTVEEKAQVHTKATASSFILRSCYVNMLSNNLCHQSSHSPFENKSNLISIEGDKKGPADHANNTLPTVCSSVDEVKVEINTDVDMTIKNVPKNSIDCVDKQSIKEEPSAVGEIPITSLDKVASENEDNTQKYHFPDDVQSSSEHSEKLEIPELKCPASPLKETIPKEETEEKSEDLNQVKGDNCVDLKDENCKKDSSDNNQCEEKPVSDDNVEGTVCSNALDLNPLCNS